IFGREVAKGAIQINAQDDDYHLSGYAIQPNMNRATKYYMFIYMNHRMVRHPRLYKAIQDAYHSYMPNDRYPIVVLNIEMDAQLIDVNVHPSKWEVRLSKEKQLENLIYTSIKEALKKHLQVPEIEPIKEKTKVEMPSFDLYKEEAKVHQELHESFAPYNINQEIKEETTIQEDKSDIKPITKEMDFTEKKTIAVNPSFPELQVIGQFHGNYILAQGEKGLYIIDQHAAQEKYHYEVLRNNIFKSCETQTLLIPEVIKVSTSVLVQLNDINEMLKHMQIECECFGEDAVIIREIPIWLKDTNLTQFMNDLFDFYLNNQKIEVESLRKAVLASLACHSSIRFNRKLNLEEMKQVIEDLKKCDQPFHCPHGRPTLICITDEQLIKEFNR
ncbi:MAG: DNA mismatch repair endonuclease MutL, partial [Traorella sp.]